MPGLFLSYHSPDRPIAEALAARLGEQGLDCFLAPWSLRPGAFWLPELAQAISDADGFVLLLGKGRPGPWQLVEYYEAFDRKARRPEFPLIPLVLPGAEPRLPFLGQLHWIEARDAASTDTVRALLPLLAGETAPRPDALWRALTPYRGLNALGEEDADFFFGRESQTSAVIESLRAGARSLMMVGNSGVGKSSLVDAGIIPALRRQRLPAGEPWPDELEASRKWLFLPFRAGSSPLVALARAFVSLWRDPEDPARATLAETWAQALRQQDLGSILAATRDVFHERLRAEPPERFVLVLNQGEELYPTLRTADSGRLSALLGGALESPDFSLIGSLRSDHYGRFQDDRDLFPSSIRVDVEPLWRAEQLSAVIERPATALGVRFDLATAPADIAHDAARIAGGLPLLCYLLEEMWQRMQRRGDGVLRWADYSELQGVEGVLATRLADYLDRNRGRTAEVRRLLTLRLAHVARGREVSRREALQGECAAAEWEHVEALAGAEWRLIVTGEEAGQPTAEVAHEAVLRAEGPVEWIRDDSQFLEWKGRLEEERRLWEEKGRTDEWLLEGGRLREFQQQVGKRRGDLGAVDRGYLERCERRVPGGRRSARRLAAAIALLAVSLAATIPFLVRESGYRRHERAAKALVGCGAQVRSLPDGSTEVSFNPGKEFHPGCLENLRGLRDLHSVDLAQMSVGSDDLKPLSGLDEITRLNLAGTRISDAGIRLIEGLPRLAELTLSDCRVRYSTILSMPEPKRFRTLILDHIPIGAETLERLERFSELRMLSLTGTGISDRQLQHVGRLPHLEDLYLDGNQPSGDGLSHLERLGSLRQLDLARTQLDDTQLVRSHLPPSVVDLDLSGCRLRGAGIGQLAKLKRLGTLNLSGNAIESRFLSLLGSIESLSSLWLSDTHLTDEGLQALCRLHRLRTLSVPNNELLSELSFLHVPELDRLERLYAGGTGLGDASLRRLASMASLRFLRIPATKISPQGLRAMVRKSPPVLSVLVSPGVFSPDELRRATSAYISVVETD